MKINLTDEIWRILEKNRHYFVHHNFSRLKIIRLKIPGPGPAPVKFCDPRPRPRSKTGPRSIHDTIIVTLIDVIETTNHYPSNVTHQYPLVRLAIVRIKFNLEILQLSTKKYNIVQYNWVHLTIAQLVKQNCMF